MRKKEKKNRLKKNECKCNKIIMNMSIAKSRRIIIGRLNIKTYTSEVQREIGLYLINKIHFRYAVTDPPKQ
jgi:hypothetical protein